MSQNVWATPDASTKSKSQARRRHPSTFIEEPTSKKIKVKGRDKAEETEQEISKRIQSQPSSRALIPPSGPSGPPLQIPEFSFLTTYPSPVPDSHAYQEGGHQSVMRVLMQCDASKEDAGSWLNKYLDCLGLPPGQKGKNVGDTCLNTIFSQEGFSDIFSHAGCGGGRKFYALVVAFGLLTRQVGNGFTHLPALVKASIYCMAKEDQEEYRRVAFCNLRESDAQLLVTAMRWRVLEEVKKNHSFNRCWTTYEHLIDVAKAWELQNPGSVRQFGKMFWQRVKIMMLMVPEADDLGTQVGLMYYALVDMQLLCLQETSEAWSHVLSKAPQVRYLFWLYFENLSLGKDPGAYIEYPTALPQWPW